MDSFWVITFLGGGGRNDTWQTTVGNLHYHLSSVGCWLLTVNTEGMTVDTQQITVYVVDCWPSTGNPGGGGNERNDTWQTSSATTLHTVDPAKSYPHLDWQTIINILH